MAVIIKNLNADLRRIGNLSGEELDKQILCGLRPIGSFVKKFQRTEVIETKTKGKKKMIVEEIVPSRPSTSNLFHAEHELPFMRIAMKAAWENTTN